ncbi:hypothetical protein GCM10022267_04500 [Lentzea roselyniae]|uniref:DUF3307 domain-containing protein n=1 Tax=Lentzea roselyniae TaxID=531940 RepID=A0ABP6ZYZ8_9PSEU
MSTALTFAAVLPALLVAHAVGDRWAQTEHQAVTKGCAGHAGRVACASHVLTYTAVTATVTAIVCVALSLPVSLTGFLAGQAVSALTHYWIDRRTTLAAFVARFAPWKRNYYANVPGGAEHLDQSAHMVWLLVAALLTAVI